jgi:hypothetical protein
MRLPVAYRSLARPSSVLEPSHPPNGIATPKLVLNCIFDTLYYYKESAYHDLPLSTFVDNRWHHIPIQRPKTICTQPLPPPMALGESALPHRHYSMGAPNIYDLDEY